MIVAMMIVVEFRRMSPVIPCVIWVVVVPVVGMMSPILVGWFVR